MLSWSQRWKNQRSSPFLIHALQIFQPTHFSLILFFLAIDVTRLTSLSFFAFESWMVKTWDVHGLEKNCLRCCFCCYLGIVLVVAVNAIAGQQFSEISLNIWRSRLFVLVNLSFLISIANWFLLPKTLQIQIFYTIIKYIDRGLLSISKLFSILFEMEGMINTSVRVGEKIKGLFYYGLSVFYS